METNDIPVWVPRVGQAVKRRNDPEAPRHLITGVRGTGISRTISIDAGLTRWWTSDLFEPWEPLPKPPEAPPGDAVVPPSEAA